MRRGSRICHVAGVTEPGTPLHAQRKLYRHHDPDCAVGNISACAEETDHLTLSWRVVGEHLCMRGGNDNLIAVAKPDHGASLHAQRKPFGLCH